MDNQEPSSSTALTQEIEDGQHLTSPENEEQMEVDVEGKILSDHELPPKLLVKVFKMLDIKTLLSCRLVNRKWNEFVVQEFQTRSDLEIQLDCCENKRRQTQMITKFKRINLSDYLECFSHLISNRVIFPYTQFLCFIQTATFNDKDWLKFLTDFGSSIKRLKLIILFDDKHETMVQLREKLRHLLMNQLPQLEEFGIQLQDWLAHTNEKSLLNTQFYSKHGHMFDLPHLKVLYLDQHYFSKYSGLTTDILRAADNLQKIQSFDSTNFSAPIEHFEYLQNHGKLQYIPNVEMELTLDFLFRIEEIASTSPAPARTLAHEFKLKVLELSMWEVYKNYNVWEDASRFLSTLFQSNQDTLKEMRICSLGFLNRLRLPQFSKLSTLAIRTQFLEPILPFGIKPDDLFPALRSLELLIPLTTAFPTGDTISPLPTLESLKVIGNSIDENVIAQIGFMCPNLKHFEIVKHSGKPIKNFPEVGTAIWAHLTKLQSLKMKIQVGNSAHAFPAIDSCITGLSREICVLLYDVHVKAESLEVHYNAPRTELESHRIQPSILNLKELKSLEISLVWYQKQSDHYDESEEEEEPTEACLTKKALTFVSEQYAFKLMENLTFTKENQTQYI